MDQQRDHTEEAANRADLITEGLAELAEERAGTCCGNGGSWAPAPGSPVVLGCQLCPSSATYWRTQRDQNA